MEVLVFIFELALTVIIIPVIIEAWQNWKWKPTRTEILKTCIGCLESFTENLTEPQKKDKKNGVSRNIQFTDEEPIFDFDFAYHDWRESVQLYGNALTPELSAALVEFQSNMLSLQREYQMLVGHLNRSVGYSGMVEDIIEPRFEDRADKIFSAIVRVACAVPNGKKVLLGDDDKEKYKIIVKDKVLGKFVFVLQAIFKHKNLHDQLPHYYAIKESPNKKLNPTK